MRGSIHYQTGELVKVLFKPSMSKREQKVTGFIANAKTLATYREVWNELGAYAKENFALKDLQELNAKHIASYMYFKIHIAVSEQRLELISSALGKLEIALRKLNAKYSLESSHYGETKDREYDFSIRQNILDEARKKLLVVETSDEPTFCRAYTDPHALIDAITNPTYQLAAKIQYESGARLEGIERIDEYLTIKTQKLHDNSLGNIIDYIRIDDVVCKVAQLQGIEYDSLESIQKGRILDIEKGGKPGILLVHVDTYKQLNTYLLKHDVFCIDANNYRVVLKVAAQTTNQEYKGSHGLRWNFARERFTKIQIIGGLTYDQALQQVSWEMKHERASITEHYLR